LYNFATSQVDRELTVIASPGSDAEPPGDATEPASGETEAASGEIRNEPGGHVGSPPLSLSSLTTRAALASNAALLRPK
jgi:hypothetical protein